MYFTFTSIASTLDAGQLNSVNKIDSYILSNKIPEKLYDEIIMTSIFVI